MIFQDPMTSLNPTFKIGTQITETLHRHFDMSKEAARKRAVELLEEVGIPRAAERLDDYPHQFSGGMRQRVMIAIALSCNPKLLIADEPTTALDVTIQAQILDLLERLREEHEMAMIIITHDMGVVAETADDIAVMYAGQIVEQANALDLFDHPEHPYTEALLGALPQLEGEGIREGRLTAIPGRPPDLVEPAGGMPLRRALPVPGADDSCAARPQELRQIRHGPLGALGAPDERAQPHPRDGDDVTEAIRRRDTSEPGRRPPHGHRPAEAFPGAQGDPRRADRRLRQGRRRRLLCNPGGQDPRPGRRVRIGQVDDRLLHPAAHEADRRLDPVPGARS